jgi:hypothetical protein
MRKVGVFRRRLIAAVAVIFALLALPSAALAVPTLLGGAQLSFRIRPSQILISGDGTAWLGGAGYEQTGHLFPANLGKIRWLEFNRNEALGHGYIWLNNCIPYCAAGSFYHYQARIRAADVRNNHYQHMVVIYRFHGHQVTDHFLLVAKGPKGWQSLRGRGFLTTAH